jgi:hypothetical protein
MTLGRSVVADTDIAEPLRHFGVTARRDCDRAPCTIERCERIVTEHHPAEQSAVQEPTTSTSARWRSASS